MQIDRHTDRIDPTQEYEVNRMLSQLQALSRHSWKPKTQITVLLCSVGLSIGMLLGFLILRTAQHNVIGNNCEGVECLIIKTEGH
jgi:hypothetical protein